MTILNPKYFFILLTVATCSLLYSCTKCQTCKVKDAVGNTFYNSSEYCTQIDKHKKDLEETWVCNNYTVNDSDGITVFVSPEICGHIDSLAYIPDSLYHVFIADSPTVVVNQLVTRVECANHGE